MASVVFINMYTQWGKISRVLYILQNKYIACESVTKSIQLIVFIQDMEVLSKEKLTHYEYGWLRYTGINETAHTFLPFRRGLPEQVADLLLTSSSQDLEVHVFIVVEWWHV